MTAATLARNQRREIGVLLVGGDWACAHGNADVARRLSDHAIGATQTEPSRWPPCIATITSWRYTGGWACGSGCMISLPFALVSLDLRGRVYARDPQGLRFGCGDGSTCRIVRTALPTPYP